MEARQIERIEREPRRASDLKLVKSPVVDLAWSSYVQKLRVQGTLNEELARLFAQTQYWMEISEERKHYEALKKMMDFGLGFLLLVLLSPVLLAAAATVKLSSPGPVFYRQVRVGRHGTTFRIWKFRSMYEGAATHLLDLENPSDGGFYKPERDPRITKIGRFLRRSSLDELPQLFNVLAGQMSLVGPRPLAVYDCIAVPPESCARFAVIPGMTGLWQVLARDSADSRANFRLDCDYVRQRGILFDLGILVRTLPAVIAGRGAR